MSYEELILLTPEELKMLSGRDFTIEIMDDDNPSNKVERYIYEQQSILVSYVAKNYRRDVYKYYARFDEIEKFHIKKAIALQCVYTIKTGNIGMDAGFGIYTQSQEKAYARAICPLAINELSQVKSLVSSKLNSRSWLKSFLEVELNGR